ncbi:MAG: riboflavin synthase [Nitrospirae bacterium]|nr:MAG: riboflavin synthase [Nitrospirota bacterium]
MFSGLVEEMGAVKTVDRTLGGTKLSVLASVVLEDLRVGDSVNVSGVCVTAVHVDEEGFSIDLSTETLKKTTLGLLQVGDPVNLERALKLHERIGGHLVTGHVDGVGVIRTRRQEENTILMTIEAPSELLRYCLPKGSITVDGVSLTINAVTEKAFDVAIIPHTAQVTTLGLKGPGEQVNLETDLIGKYVERLLQGSGYGSPKAPPVIDRDYLQQRGLL